MDQVALPSHTFATLSQAAQAAESHEWERAQQFPERLREILAVLRGVPAPQGDPPPGSPPQDPPAPAPWTCPACGSTITDLAEAVRAAQTEWPSAFGMWKRNEPLSYATDFIKRLGCHVETLLHVAALGAAPAPPPPDHPTERLRTAKLREGLDEVATRVRGDNLALGHDDEVVRGGTYLERERVERIMLARSLVRGASAPTPEPYHRLGALQQALKICEEWNPLPGQPITDATGAFRSVASLLRGVGSPQPAPGAVDRPNDARLVRRFAEAMTERLYVNARERGKSGWENMSPKQLLRRAEQELGELRRAVEGKASALTVADEAADVGNFCAIVATVYETLAGEASPQPPREETP